MANIHNLIKQRRLELGLTLKDVSQALGVAESTILRYETSDIQNMGIDKIENLARVLKTTPAYIMGWTQEEASSWADQIKPVEVRTLPVLGKVACGKPIFTDEEREYVTIKDAPKNVDFILIAKGDSMINARINDGDYVFIKKQSAVNNGDIAVVIIDDEATLKRVHYDKEKQILQLLPENPAYMPLVYVGEELQNVQILGRAIAVMSMLK